VLLLIYVLNRHANIVYCNLLPFNVIICDMLMLYAKAFKQLIYVIIDYLYLEYICLLTNQYSLF